MDIFVRRLNKTLEENKISKYKLAKMLNTSTQCVSMWCKGKTTPTINYLKDICILLDISSDYLLGLSEY